MNWMIVALGNDPGAHGMLDAIVSREVEKQLLSLVQYEIVPIIVIERNLLWVQADDPPVVVILVLLF